MKNLNYIKMREPVKRGLKVGAKKIKFLLMMSILRCNKKGLNKDETKTERQGKEFARNRKTSFKLLKSCISKIL